MRYFSIILIVLIPFLASSQAAYNIIDRNTGKIGVGVEDNRLLILDYNLPESLSFTGRLTSLNEAVKFQYFQFTVDYNYKTYDDFISIIPRYSYVNNFGFDKSNHLFQLDVSIVSDPFIITGSSSYNILDGGIEFFGSAQLPLYRIMNFYLGFGKSTVVQLTETRAEFGAIFIDEDVSVKLTSQIPVVSSEFKFLFQRVAVGFIYTLNRVNGE